MRLIYLISALLMFIVPGLKAQSPMNAFAYEKPGFKLEEQQTVNKNGSLRFYLITGYREGVKPIRGQFGMRFEVYNYPATGMRRMAMYNLTVPELLTFFEINPDRLILEVKDPSKYLYKPEYGDQIDWMRKYTFCYELEMPSAAFSVATMNEIKADVSHTFGVTLKSERRMTDDQHRYGLKAGEPNQEVEVFIISEAK